jgi:hypothetical protein
MTPQALVDIQAVTRHPRTKSPSRLLARVCQAIGTWVETAADYHAAAATYDALRALSDAELSRRGLSRSTLARDVCAGYDRAQR